MCLNHVAPRMKLYVPQADFSIPLNYTDLQKQTKTSSGVLHDDYWNIDENESLSEPWNGVTRFARCSTEVHQKVYVGSRQTDEETGHHNQTRKRLVRRMTAKSNK